MSLLAALQEQLGDRYQIERELGRGGMGAVYLARDRQLDRLVALKALPPEFARHDSLRDRFVREIRLVAGFSHPNIVPVFGVEETPDLLAFTMGYIEGESLAARVKRAGPLTSRETVRLLQDIGYALAYAHGRGVVHRDLKPDNIMIERATGRALLMDFGIARSVSATPDRPGLTRVGEVVGTPEFMSPEQAAGDDVDGRSDLYSLALAAYFALTGSFAISGDTTQRILIAQLTQPVPSVGLARGDLPAALVEVIDRCASKDADARYPTSEALVEALDTSHLSAPEVAIPIRELAEELDAVPTTLAIGIAVMLLLLEMNSVRGWSLMDGLTNITVILGIMVARLAQVRRVRKRLDLLGFDGPAIHAGLAQVYAERRAYREALRARPGHTKRERLLLAAGVAIIPLGSLLGAIARAGRTQIGPQRWYVPPWAEALFFTDAALYGVGLVLVARGVLGRLRERVVPRFWLGTIGRTLLSLGTGSPSPVMTEIAVRMTPLNRSEPFTRVTPLTVPPTAEASTAQAPVDSTRGTRVTPLTLPSEPLALPAPRADELASLRRAVETLYAHVHALESRTAQTPPPPSPPPPER